MAFDAIGPFQFTPPKEFDGKKENFEEFTFKLKAYLFLMDAGYEQHLKAKEAKSEIEVTDADFIDESGHPRSALIKLAGQLQWILVSLRTGSA